MVGLKKNMGWLPEITSIISETRRHKKAGQVGILAFETAKTMSRLVSLYKSLSDEEITRLTKDVVKSQGVAFLNSRDEDFLLSLACAERLEDLDRAAAAVSRLGKKCIDSNLDRIDLVYTDLKLGILDFGRSEYGSRLTERKVQKMEKLVSATSSLHAALDALAEMEISERKVKQMKKGNMHMSNANFDHFNQKIEHQRKEVRNFKEISLWCKTFDEIVSMMTRIVIILYARICVVFKQYIPVRLSLSLPEMACFQEQKEVSLIEPIKQEILLHPGPILREPKPEILQSHSQKSDVFVNEYDVLGKDMEIVAKNNRVFHSAGPSTLGGSGLALRYANVILLAEKYLDSATSIGRHERESLYEMLTENLKALVRTKLRQNMKCKEDDALLADGWRGAMAEIMGWLAPMAHNTVKWQMERNVEKMKFDSKPGVLLLQTLHFSDKEKTEAAVAEVLVGLSCMYRFENRLYA
ncbi:hypothetical protein Salat_2316600 [Sesamum alatum]|uniref:Uncharacterized protein n=1 Tax=Sesamum alatum TaxID=300844 RepID=A0AAE1XWX3_9LAMI|nr:hypothetical protein Salat_2316600 [Sesamum alatum]